jgi:hypothetical protein
MGMALAPLQIRSLIRGVRPARIVPPLISSIFQLLRLPCTEYYVSKLLRTSGQEA